LISPPSSLARSINPWLRLTSTRCVQLVGNILKIIFYIDVLLRPGKRYVVPAKWPALLAPRKEKKIPRIVWQTNYTRRVTLSIYVNYLFNRLMAPTYEFRFWDDAECEEFVARNFSRETVAAYLDLQIGAAKADLWRILVLSRYGGIYLDADAALSWPPESMLASDQTELFVRETTGRLTNYFLAAAPGHPLLAATAHRIVENIQANEISSVYHMTGPTVIDELAGNAAVCIESSTLVCRQGQFTRKVFQYPDKLRGYWVKEQAERPIVVHRAPDASPGTLGS
jgi:mannosyltransferase OCH1-like enzyme